MTTSLRLPRVNIKTRLEPKGEKTLEGESLDELFLTTADKEYLTKAHYLVRENANKDMSAMGLQWYRYQRLIIDELAVRLFGDLYKYHVNGDIYIHKLKDGGIDNPYCGGFDSLLIAKKGLVTPRITSSPPKHAFSFVEQTVNFVYLVSQERTGAIGLYGFFEVLAPFLSEVKDDKVIKNIIEMFVWNLNYPGRVGFQSPFTNIVIALNNDEYLKQPAFIGGRIVGRLEDYLDNALIGFRHFIEILRHGDASHRPFTFPIPTVIYNDDLVKLLKEAGIEDLFWDVVRLRGAFYFLNGLDKRANSLFSFCCRVIADMSKVIHMARGIWTMPPSIGSINYVSINLPRVVAWALGVKHEEKYIEERLYELCNVARQILMRLRNRYKALCKLGMYPVTYEYLKDYVGDDIFKLYFNTIAVIGLAESYAIYVDNWKVFFEEDGYVNDYVKYCRRILTYILKLEEEFEQEDGVPYNLEQAPAESASYELALKDLGHPSYEMRSYLYKVPVLGLYTSQITPPYCTWNIRTQLQVEGEVQRLFTGGVIKLVFDFEKRDVKFVKDLIETAIKVYNVVYIAYTPTQIHCPKCNWWDVGYFERCPNCGAIVDKWSRIVGYYRPVSNWNPGKKLEFLYRVGIMF